MGKYRWWMECALEMGCCSSEDEVKPGLPEPPPEPERVQPRVDEDGKFLRPTDAQVHEYFERYDLDESGTMNSHSELRQLTTNLLTDLLHIRKYKPDLIKQHIFKLPTDTCWKPEEYLTWFYATFDFSPYEWTCYEPFPGVIRVTTT